MTKMGNYLGTSWNESRVKARSRTRAITNTSTYATYSFTRLLSTAKTRGMPMRHCTENMLRAWLAASCAPRRFATDTAN